MSVDYSKIIKENKRHPGRSYPVTAADEQDGAPQWSGPRGRLALTGDG